MIQYILGCNFCQSFIPITNLLENIFLCLKTGAPSISYELLQQNAECGGHIRHTICDGDCSLPVNRDVEGVDNCFRLLQGNSECGNKWFEVGENLCMCYLIELLQCDIISDGGEDLYKIGELS